MSKPEITYKLITDKLNNIFLNIDKTIRNDIKNKLNITTRKTLVNYDISLIYSLLYTDNNITKNEVVNILNETEKTQIYKRTTLYEKENNISLSFYSDLFKQLYDLYISLFSSDNLNKIIAIDGCYTNSNVFNIKQFLETSLNMGFYDVTNNIPLDLTFEGIQNKNKELEVLIDYINKNKTYFKNLIIVADRAYCSYKFINFLNQNNIKYVIRFRNNCNNFSKIKKKNFRIINNIISCSNVVNNEHKDIFLIDNKKFNNVTLNYKDEYKIITNLNSTYTNDKIFEIYKSRWYVSHSEQPCTLCVLGNVEVFFKIIKKNFKFEDLRITNNNENQTLYSIHNLKILIIYIINSIIVKAHSIINKIKDTHTIKKRKLKKQNIINNKPNFIQNITLKKNKNNKINTKNEKSIINLSIKNNSNVKINKKVNENINKENKTDNNKNIDNIKECSNKPNKSLSIKGTYKLIYFIVKSNLTIEIIKNNCDLYIKYIKNELNLTKKRICKTPFKKWAAKQPLSASARGMLKVTLIKAIF